MKKLFRLCLLTAILLCTVFVNSNAQDTTATNPGGVTNWFSQNWQLVVSMLLGSYEVVVRSIPTVRSISILTWIVRLLTSLVPDKATPEMVSISPRVEERPVAYSDATIAQHV